MRTMEPIASKVPYIVMAGNHEYNFNYSHLVARFSMIGDYPNPQPSAPLSERVNNFFYSHDIGPMHVISYNTELYYFTEWGYEMIEEQYKWLEADLRKANANRDKVPWIMVLGHRSLYCLRIGDTASCDNKKAERPYLRTGLPWKGDDKNIKFGLEQVAFLRLKQI